MNFLSTSVRLLVVVVVYIFLLFFYDGRAPERFRIRYNTIKNNVKMSHSWLHAEGAPVIAHQPISNAWDVQHMVTF